jgi:hypothetical protein
MILLLQGLTVTCALAATAVALLMYPTNPERTVLQQRASPVAYIVVHNRLAAGQETLLQPLTCVCRNCSFVPLSHH